MGPLRVISFGYLHLAGEPPPPADRLEDLRDQLADPAAYEAVLALLAERPVDGRDLEVQAIVLAQPAARLLLDDLVVVAPSLTTLALGCGQGHDRSVAIAELAAARIRETGRQVGVEHWHVDRDRVR